MGETDDRSALIQVIAWQWIGDKPLPEPMMTHFTDTYIYTCQLTGPSLNIKTVFPRYGDSHVKDKMAATLFYL